MFFEVNAQQQDFLDKEFSHLFFATIDKRGPFLFQDNKKHLDLRPQNFLNSFGQNHPLALRAKLETTHLKIDMLKLDQMINDFLNKFYCKTFQEKQYFSFCHQNYLDVNSSKIKTKDSLEELLSDPDRDNILSTELASNFFLLKSNHVLSTDYQCTEENKELLLTTYYFFRLFFEGPYLIPGGIINRISIENINLANAIAKRFNVSTVGRFLDLGPDQILFSMLDDNSILFNNQIGNMRLTVPYCLQKEEFQYLKQIFS